MKDESISWNEEAVKNINGLCSSRMERGITAKELARLSNVAANCICAYERGQRLPSVKNYNKLARFFRMGENIRFTTLHVQKIGRVTTC